MIVFIRPYPARTRVMTNDNNGIVKFDGEYVQSKVQCKVIWNSRYLLSGGSKKNNLVE